jgi:hypothetical protein
MTDQLHKGVGGNLLHVLPGGKIASEKGLQRGTKKANQFIQRRFVAVTVSRKVLGALIHGFDLLSRSSFLYSFRKPKTLTQRLKFLSFGKEPASP